MIIIEADSESHPDPEVVLDHNFSERFECRFSSVKFMKSNAIMLKGMEDSIFGVWIAHGEGRFTFKNDRVSLRDFSKNLFLKLF